MSKRELQRKRHRRLFDRRPRNRGRWLTHLQCKPCRVWRNGLFGRREKDGWELLAVLAYLDWRGRLWVQLPGYAWDGPSYPDLIGAIVGPRNLEALLAASAHHDDMGEGTVIYGVHPDQVDTLRVVLLHRQMEIILQVLEELRRIKTDVSIIEGARLYRYMIRDWPDPDESISRLRRLMQSLGLVLFQRKFRLLSGGGGERWKKVTETEETES